MLTSSEFIRDGKFNAPAIDAARAETGELVAALAQAGSPEAIAALAIVAGHLHLQDAAAALLPLLARDGIAGRAAAWALGSLPTDAAHAATSETALLAAIATGSLDVRDNAYQALGVLAARGLASATLADAMTARIQAEIDRAKSGGSGLGEQVCRVLALLGSPALPELIQRVIENDRYCDRFELQRLRKAVEDGGSDRDALKALSAPWRTVFADHLFVEPAPASPAKPEPSAPSKVSAQQTAGPHGGQKKPTATPAHSPQGPDVDQSADGAGHSDGDGDEAMEGGPAEDDQAPGAPAIVPIDWKLFGQSPEAKALPPQVQQMASQLGPLLEQLSARAVRAALADLSGQEFVALLLQVLPQALPPQHVQMALSPPAVNAYQAIVKYLARSGLATNGQELIDAVKMVRQELTNQIRQSGILGGPDYKDPDEKSPAKP